MPEFADQLIKNITIQPTQNQLIDADFDVIDKSITI